ncbi:cytochrome P450 family 89 subfamily A polypeptide 5 [Citrus sinensis]|nr:cytochrome P450 family 89 subfamily A polypeptide 5 [Citrus sinensis]
METCFTILIFLCISAFIKTFINLINSYKNQTYKLPPGPSKLPIISKFLLVIKSLVELETIIRTLHSKYGPLITLHIGSRPAIIIADRFPIHQALIQNSAVFANRPPATAIAKITSSKQHNINTAAYGPTWRFLRRNLTSEILSPPPVRSYWRARKWVLQILLDRLNSELANAKNGDDHATAVGVFDHFLFVMFSLLVLMCFGDKLDEKKIIEVEDVQRLMVLNLKRFNVLNFCPRVTKIVFRKLWEEFCQIRKQQDNVLMPLIRERRKLTEERLSFHAKEDDDDDDYFLDGGTATTTTSLQWVMANLVKYPHVQEKLFKEIKGVLGDAKRQRELRDKDDAIWVGRRMCPGLGLALLHLKYFVANLIWSYEWKPVDGDDVDLEEKQEFTVVMKTPLRAHICPRSK